jgi:hypothetical protein
LVTLRLLTLTLS